MKRNLILAAVFALALAATASAQKATDFSGTWNLDVSKSKPAETMIESQTITVTQTAADIKVDRATKRKENPNGGGPGGGRGFGGGGGEGVVTYTLDGKAVETEQQTQMGSMKISTKSKIDGSTFNVTRTIATPMGDRVSTEKWTLNSDGTLTIESTRPNRDGGTDTTTRVYTKKS